MGKCEEYYCEIPYVYPNLHSTSTVAIGCLQSIEQERQGIYAGHDLTQNSDDAYR